MGLKSGDCPSAASWSSLGSGGSFSDLVVMVPGWVNDPMEGFEGSWETKARHFLKADNELVLRLEHPL